MTSAIERYEEKGKHEIEHVGHRLLGEANGEARKEVASLTEKAPKTIEANLNKLAGDLSFLPDGTYHPAELIHDFQHLTGIKLDAKTEALVNQFGTITRDGNHFCIQSSEDHSFPVDQKNVKSVDLSKSFSFDLEHQNGNPEFAHIKGLTVNGEVAGQSYDTNITSLTFGKNAGKQAVTAEVQNPLPGAAQAVLGEPGHIPVQIQFGANGKPEVTNQKQIEQKLKGGDPLTSSLITTGQDASNFWNNPSASGALGVLGDVGYTTFVAPIQTAGKVAGNLLSEANPFNW